MAWSWPADQVRRASCLATRTRATSATFPAVGAAAALGDDIARKGAGLGRGEWPSTGNHLGDDGSGRVIDLWPEVLLLHCLGLLAVLVDPA